MAFGPGPASRKLDVRYPRPAGDDPKRPRRLAGGAQKHDGLAGNAHYERGLSFTSIKRGNIRNECSPFTTSIVLRESLRSHGAASPAAKANESQRRKARGAQQKRGGFRRGCRLEID